MKKYNQRGYSIIEIAIITVVVLMMSSFLAVNYFTLEDIKRNKQTAAQMEQIEEAIINYAAANHTDVNFVDAVNSAVGIITVRWTLPAGRPYLPCPDVTGDGLEDRVNIVIPAVVTITVGDDFDSVPNPLEVNGGGCFSSRGTVPWRTLDVPSIDPWGHRYTYRVANIFSNALIGFDQNTQANTAYNTRPLTVLANGNVRKETFSFDTVATVTATLAVWGSRLQNFMSPSVVCNQAPCPSSTVTLVAGIVATVAQTIFSPADTDFNGILETTLTIGGLVSGVPFVIVSHGKNGYGAVRELSAGGGYDCVPFPPPADADINEQQNAVWRAPISVNVSVGVSIDYICPDTGVGLTESGFVDGINNSRVDDSGEYDDIVSWMSLENMIAELNERQVFPAPLLPPIGLER